MVQTQKDNKKRKREWGYTCLQYFARRKQMDKSSTWQASQRQLEEKEDQPCPSSLISSRGAHKVWGMEPWGGLWGLGQRNQYNWLHSIVRNSYTQNSLLESLQPKTSPLSIWQRAKVFLCVKLIGEKMWILWPKPELGVVAGLQRAYGSPTFRRVKCGTNSRNPNPTVLTSNKADL